MKKMIMLCPVGTSLYGNIEKKIPEKLDTYKSLLQIISDEIDTHGENWDDWSGWGQWGNDLSCILDFYIQEKVKGEPTAELTSTINWLLQQPEPIDLEIHFFPSENNGSLANTFATQYILKKMFERSDLHGAAKLSFSYKIIPVDVSNKDVFDRSVNRLFETYNTVIESNVGTDVVINATGGYKSISAYSVLYAQLRELPSIYNFEKTNKAFELLPLPISYALDAMDEEMNMLRAIQKGRENLKGYEKSHFRPWLRALVQSQQSPEALINMFLDHHARQKARGGAYGSELLEVLREREKRGNVDGATPYYDYLAARIGKEWSELWMGDQIPETVEHSRQHSKRLMELASYLFRADCPRLHQLKLDEPFSLALLISAIFLHDIGHTAVVHPIMKENYPQNAVFPLGLFPSCVREVHHLLSAELIRTNRDDLFPEDDLAARLGQGFPLLRDLVPLVSEHHRGYTRLLMNIGDPGPLIRGVGTLLFDDYFDDTLQPLRLRLDTEKNVPADLHERILRVVALLRVLDGCDVQADRVVGQNYMRARLDRTKVEAAAMWRQMEGLLADVDEILQKKSDIYRLLQTINVVGDTLTIADAITGQIPDTIKTTLKKSCKEVYQFVIQELHELKKTGHYLDVGNAARLQFLSLCNRFAFKWEQFLHFHKHRCVAFIMPLVTEQGYPLFQVWPSELEPSSDPVVFEQMKKQLAAQLAAVCKDIEDEELQTEGLLKELNIEVELAKI